MYFKSINFISLKYISLFMKTNISPYIVHCIVLFTARIIYAKKIKLFILNEFCVCIQFPTKPKNTSKPHKCNLIAWSWTAFCVLSHFISNTAITAITINLLLNTFKQCTFRVLLFSMCYVYLEITITMYDNVSVALAG